MSAVRFKTSNIDIVFLDRYLKDIGRRYKDSAKPNNKLIKRAAQLSNITVFKVIYHSTDDVVVRGNEDALRNTYRPSFSPSEEKPKIKLMHDREKLIQT